MGIYERKEREKEERRAAILSHAKTLIHECGAASCSMQDIANRAEVSKATLYLYFKSKEDLMDALVSEACQDFVNYVNARIEPEMSGVEALRTLWQSYIDIFGEFGDIFICIGLKNSFNAEFKAEENLKSEEEPFFRLVKLIEKIIEKGVKDGTLLKKINPQKITGILILIASAVVQNTANLPEDMRNSKAIISEMRTVFEIILRGLASDNADNSLLSL
ncbi:TetR/AcrR family transcriptional regulator [Treponema pedis]|uniref:TetR family transcriptional regulator n=2 Tax=Treponema pedis TaxID=409322 RepID=S6A9A3_9SPIR|nr:TetR/AcrR family transcriptional regulator [Treponema pedis]AGT45224.1 TetR family transcriptional regulator [Treponema pedis str. T A4]QOW60468.1 TetR/AcrR family transcriptional regulator [Treponema pedis]QSI05810.1 TetR/AcrR family transcriptional regulator [Treponema pedis]